MGGLVLGGGLGFGPPHSPFCTSAGVDAPIVRCKDHRIVCKRCKLQEGNMPGRMRRRIAARGCWR